MTVRLGTRGSQLALIQAGLVADLLRRVGEEVEIVRIVTEGDLRPMDMTPGVGVFVAAIARALVAGEIDLAVHSAKDLPLEEEDELVIGAYPERADARDALVGREPGATLESLPVGTVIGTDSPRRAGFL
ncbi:MAG TPA: hydroxymethylbilane synthase, partial [Candidatus Dormibacteraeota bacterium]